MPFDATMRKTRSQLPKFTSSNSAQDENCPFQVNGKNKEIPGAQQVMKLDSKNVFKRKAADVSNDVRHTKRSAFGDITNAIEKVIPRNSKKDALKAKKSSKTHVSAAVNISQQRISTIRLPEILKTEAQKSEPDRNVGSIPLLYNKVSFEESSSYITASEGSPLRKAASLSPEKQDIQEKVAGDVPEGVDDFDKSVSSDPFAVSAYVMDIFEYYKKRESLFAVKKYLKIQPDVNRSMREILVDWMVEVQESFELNHETLYLAVKLVDLYLSKETISRDRLQLVGSTAIFLACKFDERTPPYIDDFLYICNDAYKRKEMISMEITLLKRLDFDIGIPLSYRFLRRYARCAKVSMETLTFARYILELSLLDYELIEVDGSILGASALFLALCVKEKISEWSPTLQYYSGYELADFYHFIQILHQMLLLPPKEHIKTIRNKYSHKVFFEVAKIPIPDTLGV